MERTFDTATVSTTPMNALAPPSTTVTAPIEFQTTQISPTPSQPLAAPSNLSSASPLLTEILDQAIRIISVDDSSFSEDEILSASLFFTSASDDAVCAAQTFVVLGKNKVVQHCFLLAQLNTLFIQEKARPGLWMMILWCINSLIFHFFLYCYGQSLFS